jgi:hypothetical protein
LVALTEGGDASVLVDGDDSPTIALLMLGTGARTGTG